MSAATPAGLPPPDEHVELDVMTPEEACEADDSEQLKHLSSSRLTHLISADPAIQSYLADPAKLATLRAEELAYVERAKAHNERTDGLAPAIELSPELAILRGEIKRHRLLQVLELLRRVRFWRSVPASTVKLNCTGERCQLCGVGNKRRRGVHTVHRKGIHGATLDRVLLALTMKCDYATWIKGGLKFTRVSNQQIADAARTSRQTVQRVLEVLERDYKAIARLKPRRDPYTMGNASTVDIILLAPLLGAALAVLAQKRAASEGNRASADIQGSAVKQPERASSPPQASTRARSDAPPPPRAESKPIVVDETQWRLIVDATQRRRGKRVSAAMESPEARAAVIAVYSEVFDTAAAANIPNAQAWAYAELDRAYCERKSPYLEHNKWALRCLYRIDRHGQVRAEDLEHIRVEVLSKIDRVAAKRAIEREQPMTARAVAIGAQRATAAAARRPIEASTDFSHFDPFRKRSELMGGGDGA